jgi:amino acid transporter
VGNSQVLAWCVALFPGAAPDGIETFTSPTLHGISAILFFLCIAYVCLWRYRDTLDFVQNEDRKRWYRWIYRTLATLMVVLPLFAAALLSILGQSTVVFWVEAFAVWVFAAYWIVKSREVTESLSGVPDATVSYFLGAHR